LIHVAIVSLNKMVQLFEEEQQKTDKTLRITKEQRIGWDRVHFLSFIRKKMKKKKKKKKYAHLQLFPFLFLFFYVSHSCWE